MVLYYNVWLFVVNWNLLLDDNIVDVLLDTDAHFSKMAAVSEWSNLFVVQIAQSYLGFTYCSSAICKRRLLFPFVFSPASSFIIEKLSSKLLADGYDCLLIMGCQYLASKMVLLLVFLAGVVVVTVAETDGGGGQDGGLAGVVVLKGVEPHSGGGERRAAEGWWWWISKRRGRGSVEEGIAREGTLTDFTPNANANFTYRLGFQSW
ncbi:hypothetical protein L6452_02669 [Arctium lappa]|uniref:Uncharacterized protein n=1 Tax=Arctium lappa TaxID=4217 RepID=A0ACB9FJK1_ARCLA|nr:hypothetical protein L6452_02669 [Arctium lappa]